MSRGRADVVKVERWHYAGMRIARTSRDLMEAWLTADGRQLQFPVGKNRPTHTVGRVYKVRVSRVGGSITMHGRPVVAAGGAVKHKQAELWLRSSVAAVGEYYHHNEGQS